MVHFGRTENAPVALVFLDLEISNKEYIKYIFDFKMKKVYKKILNCNYYSFIFIERQYFYMRKI